MNRAIVVVIGLACAALPELAEAGHCHEVAKVVGYTNCSRFGGWSLPISIQVDAAITTLVIDPEMIAGLSSQNPGTARTAMTPLAPLDAHGYSFGYRISLPHGVYIISDFVLALGIPDSTSTAMIGRLDFGAGLQHTFGRITLSGDLDGGARFMSDSDPSGTLLVEADGVFDARARADLWLSPWFTLGVQGRVDLLDTQDVSLAIVLGAHLRAFDGTR